MLEIILFEVEKKMLDIILLEQSECESYQKRPKSITLIGHLYHTTYLCFWHVDECFISRLNSFPLQMRLPLIKFSFRVSLKE